MGDSYAVNKQVVPHALKGGLANGAIKKFDTLEDLAKAYDIPEDAFMQQVARWNSFVENKKDDDFGCMIFKDSRPTATPPFYAARLWPKVHHTMGGLVIDKNAQVLGFDFKPVKGLYACRRGHRRRPWCRAPGRCRHGRLYRFRTDRRAQCREGKGLELTR